MNMFQGDTAALSALASDRQVNRLLRLRFPQNDGPARAIMLANTLDSNESLSRGFVHRVEVLSDDASIDPDTILGKKVTIELVREDGSLRYFSGYVFEFGLVKTDGGFAFYNMVLEPWLSYLRLRHDNVAFHDQTVCALTDKVFEHYLKRDWRHRIASEDPPITYICQHNETDFNLLHRHWEGRGWTYTYEHRADGHTLVLSDDTVRTAEPIEGSRSDIPYQHLAGSIEDDGIHRWSPAGRVGSDKMTVVSFNFKFARATRVERMAPDGKMGQSELEVYENTGTYGFKGFEGGEGLAQKRIEELDAHRLAFTAEGNDRTAEPGRWFSLSGHFGAGSEASRAAAADRKFLIVSVRHRASNNYQDGRHAVSSYFNEIVCIPHTRPWRPGCGYNSVEPKVYGVQTATVVGPAGEEIYTDEYGRVRVQFHWDRLGEFDERSSPWVRVMTGWAGSRFGHISLPRIGMEVVVQFLDGNLDRPLIVGCVYNANNMPPWELPANRTQSGMLTRSSIGGKAAHANALRFEDKKGAEQLWLHAEKDQLTEVEHDEDKWVGNDRRKTIDHDETSHIKHDRTETVDHDEKITVHNNRTERVDHNEHVSIGDNRVVTIGANKAETITLNKAETIGVAKILTIGGLYQTTVGGAMNTSVALMQAEEVGLSKSVSVGNKISFTAGEEFSIEVGASTFVMKADGRIEISGNEIIIRGSKKVEVHGDDVDINPN